MLTEKALFFSSLVPFLVSCFSVLCMIFFAHRYRLYDYVDERKVHTGFMPRLGGVGIFLGFIAAFFLTQHFVLYNIKLAVNINILAISGSIIFVMGVSDDLRSWRARYKFLIQCLATGIVVLAGFRFSRISYMPLNLYWSLGWVSYPLTFFWILGVTNAVNLIDGIDGQAGSISFFVLVDYAIIFFYLQNYPAMLFCLAIINSIAGFLVFNMPFPKAHIIMGDGGSQFLGFMLAVIPLIRLENMQESIALPYSFVLLLIPITDTFATIWRRLREKKPLGQPDKFHLHHKLMLIGFSSRAALWVVITVQLIINILVAAAIAVSGEIGLLLLIAVVLVVMMFFVIIHYKKEMVVKVRL